MRFINSPGPATDGLPFSQAVQVGDVLYLSGMLGTLPGGRDLAPGGMEAEARQAMDNIGVILKENGLGFEHIFKSLIMLEDMSQWAAFNKVYVGYFDPGRLPARSAFGTAGLALGGQVEIECMAYMGDTRS